MQDSGKARVEFDFRGQTVLVMGGSGVLGGALVRGFAGAGARVLVCGHSHLGRAEALVRELTDAGLLAEARQADVTSRESLTQMAEELDRTGVEIDILINAAGGAVPEATTGPDRSFFDLNEQPLDKAMALNFAGTLYACQAFGRGMAARKRGCIINIASIGAMRPLTRSVAYSAGKAAVINFTQWLAVHLAQTYAADLRVNALVPGFFLTHQNRFLLTDEQTGELTERGQRIIAHTPMKRFGQPEDLVGPALWLASDAARFVQGAAIVVDGGVAAFGGI
jgi:NAD(P)-dependent dehydrogenase (short-subunit alcohol dehydrogenase family)